MEQRHLAFGLRESSLPLAAAGRFRAASPLAATAGHFHTCCICSELSNKYPFCSAPISILQMMRRCSTQRAGPHVERQICAVETAQHKMQYLVKPYEFWTPAFHGPSQRSLCAACSCSRAISNQRFGRLMLPHHFTMSGLDIAQPRRCLCAKLMLSKM